MITNIITMLYSRALDDMTLRKQCLVYINSAITDLTATIISYPSTTTLTTLAEDERLNPDDRNIFKNYNAWHLGRLAGDNACFTKVFSNDVLLRKTTEHERLDKNSYFILGKYIYAAPCTQELHILISRYINQIDDVALDSIGEDNEFDFSDYYKPYMIYVIQNGAILFGMLNTFGANERLQLQANLWNNIKITLKDMLGKVELF